MSNNKQTKSELKLKISEAQKAIKEAQSNLRGLFDEALLEFFKNNPNIAAFSVYVNNHEFNDGDETSFSVYHDSANLTDKDGNEIDDSEKQEEINSIFTSFDIGSFFEQEFSDAYEDLTFSVENNKVITE